jgi:hypothetical protein
VGCVQVAYAADECFVGGLLMGGALVIRLSVRVAQLVPLTGLFGGSGKGGCRAGGWPGTLLGPEETGLFCCWLSVVFAWSVAGVLGFVFSGCGPGSSFIPCVWGGVGVGLFFENYTVDASIFFNRC